MSDLRLGLLRIHGVLCVLARDERAYLRESLQLSWGHRWYHAAAFPISEECKAFGVPVHVLQTLYSGPSSHIAGVWEVGWSFKDTGQPASLQNQSFGRLVGASLARAADAPATDRLACAGGCSRTVLLVEQQAAGWAGDVCPACLADVRWLTAGGMKG